MGISPEKNPRACGGGQNNRTIIIVYRATGSKTFFPDFVLWRLIFH
jgi:hypothetical protein